MKDPGARRPPFQRARRALLGTVLALLAAVGGLYLLGRRSAPAEGAAAASDPLVATPEREAAPA